MIKRRNFLYSLGAIAGVVSVQGNARAGLFDFLNEERPIQKAVQRQFQGAPAAVGVSTDFVEIYGENYITRAQFKTLQSGQAVHWWDIAPKPYASMRTTSGTEKYYFPFAEGEGGVIVICDTTGAIVSWDISADSLVPQYNPADMSDYNYYPPKARVVEVAQVTPQPSGYPPVPENQSPLGCY